MVMKRQDENSRKHSNEGIGVLELRKQNADSLKSHADKEAA
jgi:hypothetical protein